MRIEKTGREIWFDTEFQESGGRATPISFGLVRADGGLYYAEPDDVDIDLLDEWQRENVVPRLTGPRKPRTVIAAEIREFVGPSPVFWAYNAATDWTCLYQLYGILPDRPEGWPMFCLDARQVRHFLGDPPMPPRDGFAHGALADAQWLAWKAWPRLLSIARLAA